MAFMWHNNLHEAFLDTVMILSFWMDMSVNSVDPNQIAPERETKGRLGSERYEVGTLIAGGTVTLPSHKGALCRRQERGRE